MKKKIAGWTLVALTLLAGCVPSLNPVYTDQQLIFEPDVLGVWTQANGQDRWEFSQGAGKSYRLVYTDDSGRQGRFVAHLAEIEGVRLLDLFPEEADDEVSGFYKFHLAPLHTIYLVKRTDTNLELAAVDYKWFDRYLTDNPGAIQFATFNGRKMITAPTEDVQAFVLQNKDKFTAEFRLERQPDSVN